MRSRILGAVLVLVSLVLAPLSAQTTRVLLISRAGETLHIANAPDLLPDTVYVAKPVKKKNAADVTILMLPPAGEYRTFVRISPIQKNGQGMVVFFEQAVRR